MCEVLALASATPLPFGRVLPWARAMETLGVAGFGWGVAWVEAEGVRGYRTTASLAEDAAGSAQAAAAVSTRFLVHLRRPSRLSTRQIADAQPFLSGPDGGPAAFAFSHNGYFQRHEEFRPRFAERLRGKADSEVGFVLLEDLLAEGVEPGEALPAVHRRLGGTANFGYLSREGRLVVYAEYPGNPVWAFRLGDVAAAATAIHSADDSLFELIFPEAEDRRIVSGTVELTPPAPAGAGAGG
jgi:predicted glutamine amidotransferase